MMILAFQFEKLPFALFISSFYTVFYFQILECLLDRSKKDTYLKNYAPQPSKRSFWYRNYLCKIHICEKLEVASKISHRSYVFNRKRLMTSSMLIIRSECTVLAKKDPPTSNTHVLILVNSRNIIERFLYV